MELKKEEIKLSTRAINEWRALRDATLLYRQVFVEDEAPITYRYEVLHDGCLRLTLEIGEQPFPYGMYLLVTPEHWRCEREDA